MQNDWDSYFARVNDAVSSIFVDLGARDGTPDRSRPHLLWVWLAMQAPRPDGLSSSDEAPTLHRIEDQVVSRLESEVNARFVGRITGNARRDLYFYAPNANGFPAVVRRSLADFPDYRADIGDQPDGEWRQYLDVLFPGPRDLERIKNRRTIEALEAHGNVLREPRPITHWIYFASAAERAATAERLQSAGFHVGDSDPDAGAHVHPFGLRAERVDSADQTSIDRAVLEILSSIEGVKAEYDGWESPVVTS